jgi:hypothetical protein
LMEMSLKAEGGSSFGDCLRAVCPNPEESETNNRTSEVIDRRT